VNCFVDAAEPTFGKVSGLKIAGIGMHSSMADYGRILAQCLSFISDRTKVTKVQKAMAKVQTEITTLR
jgi:hypothetical protein